MRATGSGPRWSPPRITRSQRQTGLVGDAVHQVAEVRGPHAGVAAGLVDLVGGRLDEHGARRSPARAATAASSTSGCAEHTEVMPTCAPALCRRTRSRSGSPRRWSCVTDSCVYSRDVPRVRSVDGPTGGSSAGWARQSQLAGRAASPRRPSAARPRRRCGGWTACRTRRRRAAPPAGPRPASRACRKPAARLSPAPTVSTTSAGGAATCSVSSAVCDVRALGAALEHDRTIRGQLPQQVTGRVVERAVPGPPGGAGDAAGLGLVAEERLYVRQCARQMSVPLLCGVVVRVDGRREAASTRLGEQVGQVGHCADVQEPRADVEMAHPVQR